FTSFSLAFLPPSPPLSTLFPYTTLFRSEEFFSQFGRGAPNKCLPDWVFFAEREKQLELLKGEWQGDGCRVDQARQKYLNITTTRSEEHTSELQSRVDLVCRLLLEKKNRE